ncbi:Tetratricopeptide TPR_2 repeat protein [Chthoniobacter flavus Ellin428]|uniref:protein O-GlcNAc transferase n=1 Tax=Chthoniobacter flavus Ellin428 TaxID=497964 RepID=B4D6E0_9BACT|nr:glycosyltransferase family 41 protein [Chthoniobacter flavus]EDY18049.1 Tetratricopeptide TPR_2 repeat protein [Chthoniobacter flavus Ellin428]TCO88291.1 putative O-linked N-acetylglucosamine transferase (SPINDLY family) [Chthoniobacter flavus]
MTLQEAFQIALQHHQAGRLVEAESLYRQILAVQPGHAETLHLLGALAQQVGRTEMAIEFMRQAIAADPNHAAALSNLAATLLAGGRAGEAAEYARRAVEVAPGFADAHYNLGAVLAELGQMEEALASYRRALEIQPTHAVAENNLGNILRELRRLDEAIAAYRRAIQLQPAYADAHNNLGVALSEQGKSDEAIAAYGRALELKPDGNAVHANLGNALRASGRYAEAVVAYRRSLQSSPARLDICQGLGEALVLLGRFDEAGEVFRLIVRCNPDDPEAWASLANVLQRGEKLDDAIACYRQALRLDPEEPFRLCRLAALLQRQRRLDDAAAALLQVLELQPNQTEALYRLAEIYKDQGRSELALELMRRLHGLAPEVPRIHSDLILMMLASPEVDERAVRAEGRRWDERFGHPIETFSGPYPHERNPERKLRIGYVSADFKDHVVGRNLLPLFRQQDRTRHEILCYSGVASPDHVTEEFRAHADVWREAFRMSDEELAEAVGKDRVDILVDLSLHTAGNRLMMFARRPAPVQVSFAGYPGSTGLEAMGYRISDRYLEVERAGGSPMEAGDVALIDSFWCYDPCGVKLAVSPSPARENGFVTFASLNDFGKINRAVFQRWAAVLRKATGSRLLLLTYPGEHRRDTIALLREEGIEENRVEFLEPRPRAEYLRYYHRADAMLDPFPYNGHTTSLDALWMGVPVVSLAGERMVSRAGLSQLTNLGLPELVARTEDEYVEIATRLAGDLPRLAELRATLRSRMEVSVLMDAPRFARQIETAYRTMWRDWCAKNPISI